MIVLTEHQSELRLDSNENLSVILRDKRVGNHTGLSRRKVGDVKTIEEKKLMAELAVENKVMGIPYTETAAQLGIGPTTLSAYVHGQYTNNPLDHENNTVKPKIADDLITAKAADRLMNALELMTPDKMQSTDAEGLANIAVKMATVGEKVNGKNAVGAVVQVNIYKPEMATENHFDTIEVTT